MSDTYFESHLIDEQTGIEYGDVSRLVDKVRQNVELTDDDEGLLHEVVRQYMLFRGEIPQDEFWDYWTEWQVDFRPYDQNTFVKYVYRGGGDSWTLQVGNYSYRFHVRVDLSVLFNRSGEPPKDPYLVVRCRYRGKPLWEGKTEFDLFLTLQQVIDLAEAEGTLVEKFTSD